MATGKSNFIFYTAYATFIYALCAGFRDNYGIMLPYIVAGKTFAFADVSFVIALGQLFFGIMQPVFAYLAFVYSNRAALALGVCMMLAGLLLIPWSANLWLLALSLGILLPSGTAAASFGILMSSITPKINQRYNQLSGGFVAGGIGFGICLLSPILQGIIANMGLNSALFFMALMVSVIYPVSVLLTRGDKKKEAAKNADSFMAIVRKGCANVPYRLVAFGFFTCGFHMALIQTHLFSQLRAFGIPDRLAAYGLSIYGLGTILGSVGSGALCARFSMAGTLGSIYTSRIIWVILLLLPLPTWAIFLDIFMLGATGVATVPPTAGIINRVFGVLLMPTLFGIVYVLHQIGAFGSAWAGGICFQLSGSYTTIWYVDICLCLLAGIACFSILKYEPARS